MKYLNFLTKLWFIAIVLLTANGHLKAEEAYRVSVDDEISVTVYQEPDVSVDKVKVGTNGTISMPLIGQVKINGLTVPEIEYKITTLLLAGYLKNPKVNVSIIEYRPFYIKGQVRRTGSYPYRKHLTVEKAVTLAGGFTERASKSNIVLIRENESAPYSNVDLNFKVQPGDVITISESFF